MYLQDDDKRTDNPTNADIARAIPDRSPSPDWSLVLARSDDDMIIADGRDDGRYDLEYELGKDIYNAAGPVSGEELRTLFTLYLDGDEGWRARVQLKRFAPAARAAGGASGSAGYSAGYPAVARVAILAVGAFFLIAILSRVGVIPDLVPDVRWPGVTLPPPFDSTAAQLVLAFFGVVVLIFVLAVAVKAYEVRKAARWPMTMGTIVKSESGFELKRTAGGDMPVNRRVANIAFEFKVGGRSYTGTRFTLAEITAEEDVPQVLARYPKGKTVPVYYNPADPTQSVLERDTPKGLGAGCLLLALMGIAGVAILIWLISDGEALVHRVLPNAFVPVMVMTALGGLVCIGVFINLQRRLAAARKWPKTMGAVVHTEVAQYTAHTKSSSGELRAQTRYMPVVEYSYKVLGKEFRSRTVRLDTEVSGSQELAQGVVARYPVGRIVTVFCDPADPSRAALEFRGGWTFILLAIGLVLLAVAFFTSGPAAVP
jgi:hypothetical protein